MAPTIESITSNIWELHLADVEERLVTTYGADRRTTVHALIEQERHRFADASIHAFLPILIERSVRSHLTDRQG